MMAAAPSPWTTRTRLKANSERDSAQPSEASVNTNRPVRNTRR